MSGVEASVARALPSRKRRGHICKRRLYCRQPHRYDPIGQGCNRLRCCRDILTAGATAGTSVTKSIIVWVDDRSHELAAHGADNVALGDGARELELLPGLLAHVACPQVVSARKPNVAM